MLRVVGAVSTVLADLGGHVVGQVAVLAQRDAPTPPGKGPEFGSSTPTALVVILLLGLVTAFLIRGMNKRIRRLPASFEPPAGASSAKSDAAPSDTTTKDD
jgi:hypothetical protein